MQIQESGAAGVRIHDASDYARAEFERVGVGYQYRD